MDAGIDPSRTSSLPPTQRRPGFLCGLKNGGEKRRGKVRPAAVRRPFQPFGEGGNGFRRLAPRQHLRLQQGSWFHDARARTLTYKRPHTGTHPLET